MAKPIVYRTTQRIKFSDLDPFNHLSTGRYAAYYADHRMESLAKDIGWDLKSLDKLGFMTWVRRMEIDFLRPVGGDQDITITSLVREFQGPDALIECAILDAAGKTMSRCLMTVAHIDKTTSRAKDWPPDLMALFFEKEAT